MKSVAVILLWLAGTSMAWKLNVPRVLLPLADEGANFLVFSEGGCFTWSSTRPEVVKVAPTKKTEECGNADDKLNPILASQPVQIQDVVVSGCTSGALIKLPPRWGGAPTIAKTQAIVTAEDAHSDGHILRCDVIVDRIHRLQIVTKTLELFLEEAPEEFSVRAYDDQGNEFSTLEGIVFIWTVESSSNKGENVKFIKFRDSTYALEPSLMALEAKGQQGSKVLLEGIRTGSSKVSVRIASKAYAEVPPAEVTVMVVANLFLVPHTSFVIFGATVDYHAEQMKSNRIHKIDLASSQQYYLEVHTTSLARPHPHQKQAIVAGSTVGETEVRLRDNNVGGDDAVKSPSADLHVVQPAYIVIDIDPHSNWNVVVGQDYNIHVTVFDAQNHQLFPSSNLVAELEVEEGYFYVGDKTENGTWIHGQPLKVGTAEVRAVLLGTKDVETGTLISLEKPLKAKAQLEIFEPIILEPALSVFPWDPVTRSLQQVKYAIIGYSATSSSFVWSSVNTTVATVTQNGIAKTSGQLGEATIMASMVRASHNRGQATIIMIPVIGLEIITDQVLEVQVGSPLSLPLSFWGVGQKRFTQCRQISYTTTLADKAIFQVDKSLGLEDEIPESGCTTVELSGLAVGFSKVTVTYSYTAHNAVKISDTITIAAFDPLLPVQPTSSSTVIALGASVDVVWSGGPQPWIFRPESHYRNLEVKESSLIEVAEEKASPNGLYVFSVTCNKLGETEITLTVGNSRSQSLPHPVEVSSTVFVVCAEPDRLQLVASPERPEGPCPLMAKTGRVAALCYEDLRINVTVFDSLGRKFDNFTTLEISWEHSDETLGELQVNLGTVPPTLNSEIQFYRHFALAHGYQNVLPRQKPGLLDVTATLKKSSSYLMGRSITDKLQLQLVEDADLTPKKVALFNHLDNFAKLTVHHGSGYFDVISSEVGVANHKFTPSNRSVHLTPGTEGSTTLLTKDLCLMSRSADAINRAKATVNVIGVHKVELFVVDKVQVGHVISAQVKLWDQYGELISAELKNTNLQVAVAPSNKELITIEPHPTRPMVFNVKGAALGQTSVTATAVYGRRRVTSTSMPIQVFPPLELEPRNITLIIGAQFQVQVLGGPGQPDSNIEFSLGNGKIAGSDSSGIISALTLGSTRLIAKAVGTDRSSGKKIAFSEDTIDVHVVKLDGVRIKAPILRMRVGTEMPLAAVGQDLQNQNAFSYGSALPNLNLVWSASNQEVARLVSPFWRNGLTMNCNNNGAMRLVARKPGRIVINLSAKITAPIDSVGQHQLERDLAFKDQIEIVVFEDLNSRAPVVDRNTLLMGAQSDFQLRMNREGASGAKISFTVLPVQASQDGSEIITVSRTGQVRSGRVLGIAVILVRVTEDFSVVQELSITVRVKPISYMMLNALPIIQPSKGSSLNFWPMGLRLPLDISFHDETGVKFDAVDEISLQASTTNRPNRFDTNQIKRETKKGGNHTLSIELVQPGYTVLRTVFGHSLDDFLIFDVQAGVSPSPSKIAVGDVILLQNNAQSVTAPDQGHWNAEPNGMILVDNDGGFAVALRSGVARISYVLDDLQNRISFDVDIVKANKVTFLPVGEAHLTNVKGAVQPVAFNIMSDLGKASAGEKVNLHMPTPSAYSDRNVSMINGAHFTKPLYSCNAKFIHSKTADLNNYLNIEAGFHDGNYACLFTSIDSGDVSLMGDEVEVTVIPTSTLSPAALGKVRVPYSTAFKLASEEPMVITNVEPSAQVAISGLTNVLDSIRIVANDPHHLHVGRSFYTSDDSRAWSISVKSAFWSEVKPGSELSVSISSSVTGQSYQIPVKVTFRGDQCANIELGWSSLIYFVAGHYQSLLFIIASCIICVFVTRLATQAGSSKSSSQTTAADKNGDVANNRLVGGSPPFNRMQNGSAGSPSTLLNAENRPYLWTVNDSPVYGSPPAASPPYGKRSPRSLTQYSYTDR